MFKNAVQIVKHYEGNIGCKGASSNGPKIALYWKDDIDGSI